MNERRKATRRRFTGEVELLEEVRGLPGTAMARDISVTGMFLQTMAPWEQDEAMTIRFLLPSSSSHLEVQGKVVRRQGPGPDVDSEKVGVAIAFDEIPEWVLEEVRRYVDKAPRVGGVITSVEKPRR